MVATLLRSSLLVLPAPVRPVARQIVRRAISGARRASLPKLSLADLRLPKFPLGSLPKRQRAFFDDMSLEQTSLFAEVMLRSGIR